MPIVPFLQYLVLFSSCKYLWFWAKCLKILFFEGSLCVHFYGNKWQILFFKPKYLFSSSKIPFSFVRGWHLCFKLRLGNIDIFPFFLCRYFGQPDKTVYSPAKASDRVGIALHFDRSGGQEGEAEGQTCPVSVVINGKKVITRVNKNTQEQWAIRSVFQCNRYSGIPRNTLLYSTAQVVCVFFQWECSKIFQDIHACNIHPCLLAEFLALLWESLIGMVVQTSQPSRFWRKIPAFSLLLRHYDFLPNYPAKKKKKKKKKNFFFFMALGFHTSVF